MAQNPVFTIVMSDGREMKGELYPETAPQSVGNFVALANSGFYDGLIFHRVIPGFMIQGGDPKGVGYGGPGYCIRGEFRANGVDNPLRHTLRRAEHGAQLGSRLRGQPVLHHDQRQPPSGRPVRGVRKGAGGHGCGGGHRQRAPGPDGQTAAGSDHGAGPGGHLRGSLSL